MRKVNLKKICIIGLGGHATSCVDLIESTKKFEIIGILLKVKETLSIS